MTQMQKLTAIGLTVLQSVCFVAGMALILRGIAIHEASAKGIPAAYDPLKGGKPKSVKRVVYLLPKSEEAYKNEILTKFQDYYLPKHGVHDPEAKKWAAAMIFHENGSLSPTRDGDSGCSIGIPQRNVCQFGYSAKSFRVKYPEWTTMDKQLDWAAEHFAQNLQTYGTIRLAVIAHNRPASAKAGKDTKAGYYKKVSHVAAILSPKSL